MFALGADGNPVFSDFTRNPIAQWVRKAKKACANCEHYGRDGGSVGCQILPTLQTTRKYKPCDITVLQGAGRACPNDPPRYGERPKPINFPDFQIESGSGNLAIVTCVVGDNAKELAKFTMPRIEEYARRCSADLYVIKFDQFPKWPIANKFSVRSVAEKHDRTLFLDIDCFVKPSCPDMFKQFESGKVWMHRDLPYTIKVTGNPWFLKLDQEILGRPDEPLECWNTGVVLIDREHAAIWTPPKNIFEFTHVLEQSTVEYNVKDMRFEFGELSSQYNLQYWFRDDFDNNLEGAHIVHLAAASHTTRIELLKKMSV